MTGNLFYIGRSFDTATGKTSKQSVQYDPSDLTTHAVVTGMTGSGKTGLCVILLEEAALQGIPAIIIDPKGDLTNLLLHFPELAPQDFQPWIDPELARRSGKTLDQAASEASKAWRDGLTEWDVPKERVLELKNAAQFTIYTPGSDAGIPVSVLSSLAAPELSWETESDAVREKISSTVTALLGLVGYQDIDPVRSREHILLANILENAWSTGKDVELNELILQTQNPPFEKLGAFAVDAFFPPKERMELAITLNNILASPAFESWRTGQSLDIQALLFTENKRPRHSIFYLAHLSDAERMFFVTLLLSAVETWMRTQSGVTTLRALLYMDEIYGYLPPLSNPPSKEPLLRMLKQARAFGLGLLLATQNPVDVDYKGLSNAGTWLIGKLQTERDKLRLLDGLEGAAGGIPRTTFDKLISALGKRAFVLHNVHTKAPSTFQTRWTMNFLAGPLTRNQIPALNRLAGVMIGSHQPVSSGRTANSSPARPASAASKPVGSVTGKQTAGISDQQYSTTKPPVPTGIREYFLPQNYSLPEAFSSVQRAVPADAAIKVVVYKPALLGSAQVRVLDRKYNVDTQIKRGVLVTNPDRRGQVRWDEFAYSGPSLDNIDTLPAASGRFAGLEPPLNDGTLMSAMQKDFNEWVFRNSLVKARVNATLKVYGGPDVSQADFVKACADAAREAREAEIAKKNTQIDRQITSLENKIAREERELQRDETDLQHRKWEEVGTAAENVLGLFGGRRSLRRLSSSLTKRRLTEDAKANVQESADVIAQYKTQLTELQKIREETIREINDRWGNVVNDITEVTINPKRSDVFVDLFGVVWIPFYLVRSGTDTLELPAFGDK
jgi:hypothetical protein